MTFMCRFWHFENSNKHSQKWWKIQSRSKRKQQILQISNFVNADSIQCYRLHIPILSYFFELTKVSDTDIWFSDQYKSTGQFHRKIMKGQKIGQISNDFFAMLPFAESETRVREYSMYIRTWMGFGMRFSIFRRKEVLNFLLPTRVFAPK